MLIFYKLLLAVIEMLAGGLCLLGAFFVKHMNIAVIIEKTATSDNLDRAVNWIVQWLVTSKIDYQLIVQIGVLLIAFGIFNILLAIGVWFKSKKMRTLALVVFGGLSIYGIIELVISFTVFDLVSLILDLIVLYYFWKILPRHLES